MVAPPPRSSLNGPIGLNRRWAWARSQLSDVKRVRGAFGGTVNDVVLTGIGGAMRRYLLDKGELPDASLVTSMPIAVPRMPASAIWSMMRLARL